MAAKVYYEEIDVLKGIAILGIVFLHGLISPIDINGNLGLYGDIIRSFPLYLFFAISGFFFFPSANSTWREFLIKKGKRLLIPMLFFHLIIIALDGIKQYATGGGVNGILTNGITSIIQGRHYWYLYSLFILLCLNKLFGKYLWVLALVLLPVDYLSLLQIPCKPIPAAIHFNFFFFCGVMFSKWYGQWKNRVIGKQTLYAIITGALLILCTLLFMTRLYEIRIIGKLVLPLLEISFIWITALLANYLFKRNSNVLVHFGRYSLQYYCNHVPIMAACYLFVGKLLSFTASYVLTYLILVAITIICSFCILEVEKKLTKFRVLFGI